MDPLRWRGLNGTFSDETKAPPYLGQQGQQGLRLEVWRPDAPNKDDDLMMDDG